jgi:hypothetical protein
VCIAWVCVYTLHYASPLQAWIASVTHAALQSVSSPTLTPPSPPSPPSPQVFLPAHGWSNSQPANSLREQKRGKEEFHKISKKPAKARSHSRGPSPGPADNTLNSPVVSTDLHPGLDLTAAGLGLRLNRAENKAAAGKPSIKAGQLAPPEGKPSIKAGQLAPPAEKTDTGNKEVKHLPERARGEPRFKETGGSGSGSGSGSGVSSSSRGPRVAQSVVALPNETTDPAAPTLLSDRVGGGLCNYMEGVGGRASAGVWRARGVCHRPCVRACVRA